jgi:hypothetical protein
MRAFAHGEMKVLFLATYFPRPLNPTIGTWALEQAKAFLRASREAPLRVASKFEILQRIYLGS